MRRAKVQREGVSSRPYFFLHLHGEAFFFIESRKMSDSSIPMYVPGTASNQGRLKASFGDGKVEKYDPERHLSDI